MNWVELDGFLPELREKLLCFYVTSTAVVRKMGRFFEKWVMLLLCSIFLMNMDFGKNDG